MVSTPISVKNTAIMSFSCFGLVSVRSFVNLFLPAHRNSLSSVKVNAVSPDHDPSIPLVTYVRRLAIFADGNRGAVPVARPGAYLPVCTVSDKERILFNVVMWILFHLVCLFLGDFKVVSFSIMR